MDVCRTLLSAGASADADERGPRKETGWTPLQYAAVGGHVEIIRIMLAAGADVHATNEDGASAACVAAAYGHVDACNHLLDAMHDDGHHAGLLAMQAAVRDGRIDVCDALLRRGVQVRAECLCFAVVCEDDRMVDVCAWVLRNLDESANLDEIFTMPGDDDDEQESALHVAAQGDAVHAVSLLLDAGAFVDVRNSDGRTPLMTAAILGNVDAVITLLSYRASMYAIDNDGRCALWHAASGGRVHVVCALIAAGAPLEHEDRRGTRALHTAAANGHVKLVDLLVGYGAVVDALTSNVASSINTCTALYLASHRYKIACCAALLKAGANVNVIVRSGPELCRETAFSAAAAVEDWPMCVVMLRYGTLDMRIAVNRAAMRLLPAASVLEAAATGDLSLREYVRGRLWRARLHAVVLRRRLVGVAVKAAAGARTRRQRR